jgi:CENP-S associating Centromere protein X
MMQAKRARPDFNPPRPKGQKTKGSTLKVKDTEAFKRKRDRPSKAGASKLTHRTSDAASDTGSMSLISGDDEAENASDDQSTLQTDASPEPDHVLVEVTHEALSGKDHILSLPLLHRIMQEHWQNKDKTKISTDARELVGKYVEVFVREAIMRSAYERNERDKEAGGESTGSRWLEVEDLERIAPQLCLDF